MPNYLIFILLAIVPFVISKEYEFSSILYDFNGTCNDTYLCLPFSNISFSYIWENITQEEIIQELNKEVKKCPAIKRKVFFKESRVKSNDIGLFAEEEIDFNTTIGSFTPKTSITSDMDFSMFEGKDYYEQFLTFPQLNLSSDNTNNTYKMIFSLLYHAYHFEDSPFQLMFKAFPSKPNVPMFTLSIYEWKLLKPDMAFREISLSRQNIIRRYFIFNYLLNETWTPEQRRIIFNGRDEIPIDDFVYCYFIYLTRAVTISVSKDELFSSIAPFTNHIKRYKEDFNADRKQSIYLKTDDTRVRYNAHDYYEVDDEIYIDVRPIDNYYYFIVHGYFYNHNPYDCFNIQFLSEEDSKSIGLKQAECVNAKHISLERYYLICNLYNMEEKDRLACQRKIKKFEKDEGQRIRTMFEKCKHPKWKKWNIFELPKKQLEEYTIAYQKMLQKTKEYLYFRLKDQKSTETARQIYEYLSTKLVVAGDLLIRMESLEEIQVKLPKLNKKAKKEYQKKQAIQRKQEKKLEKKELEEQIIKEIQEKGEPNYEEEIDEYEEQQQQEQQQNKFQQIQDEFKEQVHIDL